MYVLIVEDDELVGDGIVTGLDALGIQSDWVTTLSGATSALQFAKFDAVVLDLGLPDGDGMTFIKTVRHQQNLIPILVLTARDAIPDRVSGLQAGADDYLTKPFDLTELAARLHSLSRRVMGRTSPLIQHGDLSYDPATQQTTVNGKAVFLSRREIAVLTSLLQPPGRIVTSAQLHDRLYGWSEGVESNAVAVHIHNLRRKLGEQRILTVRGQGYCLSDQA